jgi:glycine betaine/proline transport system substrate-binding protein
MSKRHLSFRVKLGVAMTALALVTAGCGGGGSSGSSGSSAGGKTITMGVIPGWTDETGTTALLQDVLEKNGYTVKVTKLSDNAPMYTALANGDIDILSSSWLEQTHKSYMDKYGKDLEDLGTYYEGATSFLAVPDYSPLKSIDELPAHAADFGNQVVGIEPGAGLTKMTKESVFPAYGLDKDFKLVLSSTAAMLTELKKATDAKKEIVVTMWKPFWADLKFPIKALEDPKGAYGKPENLNVLARKGFKEDQPKVASLLANFKMDEDQYNTLEDMVVNEFGEGKEKEAAAAWLEKNPDFESALAAHLKG